MKKLLIIIFLFGSFAAHAGEFLEATLVFLDGKSKKGFVESPFGGNSISYKATKDAKEEKFDAATVSKIIFRNKEGDNEFQQLKVYLGWGQKRISEPMWLQVVEKGKATLLVNSTTMQSGANSLNTAGFLDYYCIRDGEVAAKLICQVSGANNNQTFRAKAPLYFEDYPELAAKIKSKEYTWRDLVPVVQEYNKRAGNKK
jgi:hypothetical protein